MKSTPKTKTIILIVLGILFALSPIINNSLNFNMGNDDAINLDKENLKISAVSGKIHIDNNWTAAKSAGIVTGNGTYSIPYIIEDLVIDAENSGSGISISNSDVNFKIQNCTVSNSGNESHDAGIRLSDVNNGQLINNTVYNNYNGIDLFYSSSNNSISGNIVFNNSRGIILGTCDDNRIVGNIVTNNFDGILLTISHQNTISGNAANNNVDYGIYLHNSNNNNLSGNTAIHNFDAGIYLGYSSNITLLGNTANDNYYGIHLEDSSNITLLGNTANYNSWRGIYLHNSNNNTLSGNNMNECGVGLSGSYGMLSSHHIDNTNLVNGKPLYYYTNEVNLDSGNFTNAGQVILVNCNDSSISNLNTSYSTKGISLYYSNTNTISGNSVNYNIWTGIYLSYSNTNTISGNIANANYQGISLSYSNTNTISGNTANDNGLNGIQLIRSDYNTISGNIADDNEDRGIVLGNSNNNNISGNTAYHNYYHGIALYDSNNNNILGNTVGYSRYGISLHRSNNNDITGNTLIGNYECIFEDNCQGNTFSDNDRCTYGQSGNAIIPGYNLLFLLGILSVTVILTSKRLKKFLF